MRDLETLLSSQVLDDSKFNRVIELNKTIDQLKARNVEQETRLHLQAENLEKAHCQIKKIQNELHAKNVSWNAVFEDLEKAKQQIQELQQRQQGATATSTSARQRSSSSSSESDSSAFHSQGQGQGQGNEHVNKSTVTVNPPTETRRQEDMLASTMLQKSLHNSSSHHSVGGGNHSFFSLSFNAGSSHGDNNGHRKVLQLEQENMQLKSELVKLRSQYREECYLHRKAKQQQQQQQKEGTTVTTTVGGDYSSEGSLSEEELMHSSSFQAKSRPLGGSIVSSSTSTSTSPQKRSLSLKTLFTAGATTYGTTTPLTSSPTPSHPRMMAAAVTSETRENPPLEKEQEDQDTMVSPIRRTSWWGGPAK